jgi:SHOCT-like protein
MGDELTTVLRLVAEGKLSAEEAAPIIEALGHRTAPRPPEPPDPGFPFSGTVPGKGSGRGRRVRIQVTERGRRVVDVRVPLAFAAMAARMVPGIPDSYAALIERAVADDMVGPIVDLAEDEDGDGVLITVE